MDLVSRVLTVFIFVTVAANGLAVTSPATTVPRATLPKLEMGFGAMGTYLSDYPGSDQQHFRWLPVPYIVYRGDFLRSDQQGGLHGILLNSTELDIDASFDGSFPVDDSQNRARQGIPSLDWMGEIGPRLVVHLIRNPIAGLDLSLPVRWVFSTDGTRVDDRGFDFNPELRLYHRALFDKHGTFVGYTGALWATSQLTRYFYDVEPEYATADRPAYFAKPGFMYDYIGLSYHHMTSATSHLIYFVGINKTFLANSANRESPLMRSVENEAYYLGLIYNFYRSRELSSRRALIE